MARTILKVLLIIFTALLAAELIFLGVMIFQKEVPAETTVPTTVTTVPETTAGTEAPTTVPTTVPETSEPTEETTAPATEAPRTSFTLTFAGDCTLASDPGAYSSPHGFIRTIGSDYGYPFRNVLEYFEGDDFTIVNFEGVLADSGTPANKLFTFRGPTAYTQILTSSSVEGVTLANNHTEDYGKAGYESTLKALGDAGVWFVEENKTRLVTTESGLTIGLYADAFDFSTADIQKNVKSLRDRGAEIVICAFHWGTEGSYRPTAEQKKFAHAAIDAGADIVYGHHPHVLQPVEEYKDGYIFYSLGNFSFGGNNFPKDMDSAIIQVHLVRDEDGNIRLDGMTWIPVSISSMAGQNNFQPTPYSEGTKEYDRTISKLDGTFNGPDLVVDYSHLTPTEPSDPTQPSEPGSSEPPASEAPSPTSPPESQSPVVTDPPADPVPPPDNPEG